MAYRNTWMNITDSDGGSDLGTTTSYEAEQARDMDEFCGHDCACGGRFEYRPTCGCMQCVKCGEIEVCC